MIKMTTEIKPKRLFVAIGLASLPIIVPVMVYAGIVLWLFIGFSQSSWD